MAASENENTATVPEDSRTPAKNSVDNEDWFVQKSCCVDEVTLKFDDDKELYVSSSFLIYASPVFKAMLTSDFEEKKSKAVKLSGKRYDDMLKFLKCMHPGIFLKITSSNVAIIAPLAEEYQVDKIIAKCKEVMTIWLRRGYDFQGKDLMVKVPSRHPHCSPESQEVSHHTKTSQPMFGQPTQAQGIGFGSTTAYTNRFPKDVNVCYKVLRIALQLNYTDIETEAISILSNIPYKYISGEFNETNIDAVNSENQRMFKELSQNLKLEICQRRLRLCDK